VYAQRLIEENWAGRGPCRGTTLKLEALYKTSTLETLQPDFDYAFRECASANEPIDANVDRTYLAKMYIRLGRFTNAIELLASHYDEAIATHYPVLISAYEAALAQAYWETGDVRLARQFAQRSVDNAVKNQYTEAIVVAYRVLYLLAKQQGDTKAALDYHEKFAAADTGYLDDISAQQIAYQRVKHEVTANKLQIETLNKQNQVLQLERKLDAKEIENVRLYVALLIAVLAFIAFWAYKTKRSQLHFMRLARRDSLTEITNRPHFIELAEGALKHCSGLEQEAALILCDLDNFKSINDRYGHAQGDKVLKQAASACREHLRATDIFARVGGEEFCILLAGCSVAGAAERAERLRAALSAIDHSGMISKVSGSFGITSTKISGYELHQLMAHADFALYQAKDSGRNRVIVFDPMRVVPAEVVVAHTDDTGTYSAHSA
jgi:diguanylate cyclase (GGDEF)-like protein